LSEPTLQELLRNPYFRQVLFDLQTERCKRYAQDMRPITFSPAFGRKMKRLIKAQGSRVFLKLYSVCSDLLCFLRRHLWNITPPVWYGNRRHGLGAMARKIN